jgi:hypothetical protein
MLPSCLYLYVLLNLPECQADTRTAGHVSGSIWATDVPGWITAIATAFLAVGAIFTIIYAVKAFRKQSQEVAILLKQSQRDEAERRRAQASSVFIGVPPRSNRLVQPGAYNASSVPVFDAQFWYSFPGGLDGPDDLGMIMPGPVGLNARQMSHHEALKYAILTFRDAEGAR